MGGWASERHQESRNGLDLLGANPDHMHHIAQNKLKDNLPCICFKRHCRLLCLAYIYLQ